jgi:hypothetical protein
MLKKLKKNHKIITFYGILSHKFFISIDFDQKIISLGGSRLMISQGFHTKN